MIVPSAKSTHVMSRLTFTAMMVHVDMTTVCDRVLSSKQASLTAVKKVNVEQHDDSLGGR